jgi:hypothetical protein
MLRLFLLFIVFSNIISITIAQNLILNPGCEDSLINGEIPNWIEVMGTDWQNRESGNPPSYEGNNMFFAGVSQNAELQQDIDVSTFTTTIDSGIQYFYFEGYVRSYSQNPVDHSRLIIKYFDDIKSTVLDSIDFGENINTTEWLQLTDTTLAPVGTRFIRISLMSIRYNGSNNDGYFDGLSLTTGLPVSIENNLNTSLTSFTLYQNYPNPFNPSTRIQYAISSRQFVQLKVYDILGNEITTLVNEEKPAGNYVVEFKPESSIKQSTSGVYFYQLKAGDYIQTKKMIYLK